MSDFYSSSHRSLQDTFDTRRLADALQKNVVRTTLADMHRRFISASDFFFLSTVDHNGYPTVSYKGGFPGFVRVLDEATLAFPIYDGNGMFYSAGNVQDTAKVALLFMDFQQPRRLRMHGTAAVSENDDLMPEYPEAQLIVRVTLASIFTNCARYIHGHRREEASPFVPRQGAETPVPEWKRVDYLQENLPQGDKEKAMRSGETITEAEYRKGFWKGL
ncbi:MAG: pyridoxamine 5'-phosphate oxidase family protein [Silicimonas sp.]|nr:pyridoxamine 5'-phosphate oxidase family protein [Silicimonas sp.]